MVSSMARGVFHDIGSPIQKVVTAMPAAVQASYWWAA